MKQPIIVCGLGRLGWNVLGYLRAAGLAVVVIDQKARPDDPRLEGVPYLEGDFRDRALLEQAGVPQARAVILATSDDLANIAAALLVRSMDARVRIVIRMFNQNLLARLGKTVPNVFALSVSALTAPMLALIAMTGQALGGFAADEERFQIAETILPADAPWIGQPAAALAQACDCGIVARGRPGEPLRLFSEVEPAPLAPGDRLIVCGTPGPLASLLRQGEEETGDLRWAGPLRRFARILWRAIAEIDAPVKICLSVLLLVVVGSTFVFHWGMERTLPNGLYATIGVLTGGKDMSDSELPAGWPRVFVSVLRLLGVALMAAFTAIVTNYLLRMRLGAVLELRRIPEAGHVVVCGLGNVGYRVTEELIRHGLQVVVIESTSAGRFVTTARQLGAAVIQGDATVAQMHRQANTAAARALVAATNDPLVNLEIALLARDSNPKQRIVVRLADPGLAQTLREAAGVKLAFSTTALAAPAFVAAVFGDRVLNIFLIEGRVLAALDLLVEESDAGLIGLPIADLLASRRALAIRLLRGGRHEPLADARLALGDRLLLVLELTQLVGLLSQAALRK